LYVSSRPRASAREPGPRATREFPAPGSRIFRFAKFRDDSCGSWPGWQRMIYKAIVFLPAIGALIAGLLGRVLGPRPCEILTTSFVGIGAVLSWIALWQV